MRNLFTIFILLFLASCNNIEFVYSDKKSYINPLFGKTNVSASGIDVVFMKSLIPMFFGKNVDNKYNLSINITEKKIKSSVESNQTASTLNYELRFNYTLILNKEDCVVYNKEILSNFSFAPKSSGYNYGTDTSLEKKYELAVNDNFNQFVSYLSGLDLNICK